MHAPESVRICANLWIALFVWKLLVAARNARIAVQKAREEDYGRRILLERRLSDMKTTISTDVAEIREGITTQYVHVFSLMEQCGLGKEVACLCPIQQGRESDVLPRQSMIDATARLLAWIGGDAPRSSELEVVFPGQRAFRCGGLEGVLLQGKRHVVTCIGPVCKVIVQDFKGPVIAMPDRLPGDVITADDGTTLTVIATKGRSPFARFLLRVKRFLEAQQASEVTITIG